MESPLNIRLFRIGSVPVWTSSLRLSVYKTDQFTSIMDEKGHEIFNLKFEINGRVCPQASHVCWDS